MIYKYNSFSQCGPRWSNEDALAVFEMPGQGRVLFVLCDGMGGHKHGDVASRTVVEAFKNYWLENPDIKDSENKINDAVGYAFEMLNACPHCGMGTTMVLAAVEDGALLYAHCGDSRIYIKENGAKEITRTKDHIDVTPEGWRYVSKGFMQGENNHIPEIGIKDLHPGDMLMLCSDGVYNSFGRGEMEMLVMSENDIDILAERIEAHCVSHSDDNYSAILVEFLLIEILQIRTLYL